MLDPKANEGLSVPEELPVLPSKDAVVFPLMLVPLIVSGDPWVSMVEEASSGSRVIGLFATKDQNSDLIENNVEAVGTAAAIVRIMHIPDGTVQMLLQGLARVEIEAFTQGEPYPKVRVRQLSEQGEKSAEAEAMQRNLVGLFQRVVTFSPTLPNEMAITAVNLTDPGRLADYVAASLNLTLAEKQGVLTRLDVADRLHIVTGFANRELQVLEIGNRIQSEVKSSIDKTQREYYLREQLKAIQKELGEVDEKEAEFNELRRKVEEAGLPPEAFKEAQRELDRLQRMPAASPEHALIRTYLDWMVTLPWNVSTQDNMEIRQASQVLNEDHYDLEKIKDRILEYLAVRKLREEMRGPILCFVGPPGVGKTSLGQSIGRALGRKFVRISLGGVRDEADVRGHRRTYVGALPGRIIQGLRRAGSNNPVFMLDEVDKLSTGLQGDPSAALLEVLDPAQNNSFNDHYLDVAFDLSKVLFIATANVLDTIPAPLRDRMEIIQLPGYTEDEKLEIAKRYLVPRQLKENGVTGDNVEIRDAALRDIVNRYTREAGVRNLEREIATVCRKVARGVAEGKMEKVTVDAGELGPYLGPWRFRQEIRDEDDEIGVATGLAWTPTGGDVLFIETACVPGRGQLTLTGHLGDVMQESAKAALTYARSRAEHLGLSPNFHEKCDLHIHVPAGAIPKDGPSAGITMAVSIVSALAKRRVHKEVGMTGEITLRGKVLPIGGLKEKVLAAHRAGLEIILFPKENEKDLEEIPVQVRRELKMIPVEHVDQVLAHALWPEQRPEPVQIHVGTAQPFEEAAQPG
ncbi:MAG: endopeptidase La [Chloroflexota bacterium]